ncbi:MAG: hypothetical protein QM742_03550 [Aquabacterium sp.]
MGAPDASASADCMTPHTRRMLKSETPRTPSGILAAGPLQTRTPPQMPGQPPSPPPTSTRRCIGLLAAAGCLMLYSASALCESMGDTSGEPTAAEADPVQVTRQTVRLTVERMAGSIDSWFGDIPFSDGGRVSDGELGLNGYRREDQSSRIGVRFKARFKLPNLQSRTYAFIGNDDRRDIVTDQPDTFSRQRELTRADNGDNAFFAGIGAALAHAVDVRIGLRGGLKPYAQARWRKGWQWNEETRVDLRETVFVTHDDRVGSTTALAWGHALSPTLTLRWLNALTATEQSGHASWSSSLGLHKAWGKHEELSLEVLSTGVVGSAVTVADHGVQVRWQQPLHHDEVIGELLLGHFWPRTDVSQVRSRAWAFGWGIKLLF